MMLPSKDIFETNWRLLLACYDESEARSLVKWLLEDILEISQTDLLLNKTVESSHLDYFDQCIHALLNGEPIQHVLGYAWFMERRFEVNGDVLIPRQETEELVHLVMKENPGFSGELLDIGTGSGIIPISLKLAFPHANMFGLEVSLKALEVAKRNADALSAEINWIAMDILKEMPSQGFDIIVSNPPYVLERDKPAMHVNVLGKDPDLALFVKDDDPLVFYRSICEVSEQMLNQEGKIYFEIHENFGTEVSELMRSHQLDEVRIHKDLNGKDRIVTGTKKAASR